MIGSRAAIPAKAGAIWGLVMLAGCASVSPLERAYKPERSEFTTVTLPNPDTTDSSTIQIINPDPSSRRSTLIEPVVTDPK